jgi:threonine dehydratase/aspartate/methionine/tyrosine aminotransferase
LRYERMPIEIESPEEVGYNSIRYNLSESSITDQRLSDFGLVLPDIPLVYNEHRGSATLRSLIIEGIPELSAADVLITGGAAGALFIISTALLAARDHLVVVRPNYATNLETPRAIGCDLSFLDVAFEQGFKLDIDALRSLLRAETKLISITCPHNPTGVMLTEDELRQVVDLAKQNGSVLVVDETYRDLSLDHTLPLAASLGSHVISVSSLSKAYGVPGIRLGWIISSNPKLQELFLAAKEQISICGSVLHEWIGENILMQRRTLLDATLHKMRRRLRTVEDWMEGEARLEWVRPAGGVVCFPRMREAPPGGTGAFYKRLMEHGTYVGPGHWFEVPDTYFRLGYGWSSESELELGLRGISHALDGNSNISPGAPPIIAESSKFRGPMGSEVTPKMEKRIEEGASRVIAAADRLRNIVSETRVVDLSDLAPNSGVHLFAKLENEQETGSFKLRGATNKILSLSQFERGRGVVTASNGNHGLGVALAAQKTGIPAEVFVSQWVAPDRASRIEALGALVTRVDGQPLDAERAARASGAQTSRTYISPYNDPDVMAGQGTVAVELLEQVPSVDAVFVTVGGGGLIGGIGVFLKHATPATEIVGCWPQNSRVLYESLRAGHIVEFPEQKTFSDSSTGGIEEGSITFDAAQAVIDTTVLVDEDEILQAMRLVRQKHGWIIEGAAAVALAAFLKTSVDYAGKTVVVLFCGGNVAEWVRQEL